MSAGMLDKNMISLRVTFSWGQMSKSPQGLRIYTDDLKKLSLGKTRREIPPKIQLIGQNGHFQMCLEVV